MSVPKINNPIYTGRSFLSAAPDASKFDIKDPNFLLKLGQVLENGMSKCQQIAPGVFVPNEAKYQTINFASAYIGDIKNITVS